MIPLLIVNKKPTYNNIVFDSTHEVYFYWYLLELKKNNLILGFTYQPESIKLCDKVIHNKKVLIREANYTADFEIIFDPIYIAKQNYFVYLDTISLHVDIKNPFDKQGVKTKFSLLQKFTYAVHKIYIQDIEIQELFYQTFTPKRYLYSDKGKTKRTINYKVTSIDDYLKRIKWNQENQE